MRELRVRIKLGEFEFEAEGPTESVERQAEAFHQMFTPLAPGTTATDPPSLSSEPKLLESTEAPTQAIEAPQPEEKTSTSQPAPLRLDEILHVRGAILSLSIKANPKDAVLLILLGQRHFRRNEAVSGIELMQGLRNSGVSLLRVDTLMTKLARQAIVIAMGKHRRRRYRLSVGGLIEAEQIARRFADQLHPPTQP